MAPKWSARSFISCDVVPSVLHAIGNYQVSAFKNFAVEQLKIDLLLHLVKEWNA